MKHVMPTPWCFLGTLPSCNGAGPLWSCPDSTLWQAGPTVPCHAMYGLVPPVSVPYTGIDAVQGEMGGLLVLTGALLLVAVRRMRRA